MDPWLTFGFRVRWNGRYVAAVNNVSGLSRRTSMVSFHAGGQPQPEFRIPGESDYEPVRLQRGITMDASFEQWAQMLASAGAGPGSTRKDLQIEVYDQACRLILRYDIHRCWPSEYTALPELDSDAGTVALASLTLEHEGWERDPSVTPPA